MHPLVFRFRARLDAKGRHTYQLHTHGPQLVSHLDRLIEALPSNVRTRKRTRKRVPGPIRIHDQLARDRRYRVHLGRIRPVDDDGRFGAPSDHHDARTCVDLVVRRDTLGNLRHVGRVGFEDGSGVRLSFRFVPDEDVGVGEDLL